MSFRPLKPRPRVAAPHSSTMVTKQSMKDECDINKILLQYKKTGILTHINNNKPQYLDLPDASDYQEAIHLMMEAEEAFSSLPSVVRDHFKNDPASFLEAFSDPSQADYLREVGLLKPLPGTPPALGGDPPQPAPGGASALAGAPPGATREGKPAAGASLAPAPGTGPAS